MYFVKSDLFEFVLKQIFFILDFIKYLAENVKS